jgi:hypothetical protein
MTPALAPLISSPPTYDFDVSNPGIQIEMYGNDHLNDCVIAARAHHTIRLTHVPGLPFLTISQKDVSTEYFVETHGKDSGLPLTTSLQQWKDSGWSAGGTSGRTIKDFITEGINGDGLLAPDPASEQQLMNCIIENNGVQADLLLPKGIGVDHNNTYGPFHPWLGTSGGRLNRHIMLLTGYDGNGPIGITWGTKQSMTWQFLHKYCIGIYSIQRNDTT